MNSNLTAGYPPPYMCPMSIATRLDRLMKAKKVRSQSSLARLSGVPQPTINRILKGQTDTPEFGTVKKLAAALGVQSTWLAEGPGDDPPVSATGAEVPDAQVYDSALGSAELLKSASQAINDRVRTAQVEAAHHLIEALPSAVLSKLLGFLQEGDFTIFDTNVSRAIQSKSGQKEIDGGEQDPPIPQKRGKLR